MVNKKKIKKLERDKTASSDQEASAKERKLLLSVSILLLVLLFTGVLVFILTREKDGGGDDNDSGSIITYVPIWIAVWVPLWAATRKKRKELDRNTQMIIIGIGIVLALLAVAGLVVFLMMS